MTATPTPLPETPSVDHTLGAFTARMPASVAAAAASVAAQETLKVWSRTIRETVGRLARATICAPRRVADAPPMIESVRRVPVALARMASAPFARALLSVPVPRTMTGNRAFGEAFAAARRAGSTFAGELLDAAVRGVAPRTSAIATSATSQRAMIRIPTGLTLHDLPRSTSELYWPG